MKDVNGWSLQIFGRICKATDRTDFDKLAYSFTVTTNLKTPAILHGQKYETVALSKYEEHFGRVPIKCGIFVSKTHPFIAASPDEIIHSGKHCWGQMSFYDKGQINFSDDSTIPCGERGKLALEE